MKLLTRALDPFCMVPGPWTNALSNQKKKSHAHMNLKVQISTVNKIVKSVSVTSCGPLNMGIALWHTESKLNERRTAIVTRN